MFGQWRPAGKRDEKRNGTTVRGAMDRPQGLPRVDSAGGKIGPATGRTVNIGGLTGPRDVAMTVRAGMDLPVGSAAMDRPMEIGGMDLRADRVGLMDRHAGLTGRPVDRVVSMDRHAGLTDPPVDRRADSMDRRADLMDRQVDRAATGLPVGRADSMDRHAGLTDLQVVRAAMGLPVDRVVSMGRHAGLMDRPVDRVAMGLRVGSESLMDRRAGRGLADSTKVGVRLSAVVSAP